MHLHILGICGTFMGGIAQLAKALGHHVTGSDTAVYPPMSTQLANAGIEVYEGYSEAHLKPAPDQVVVGNAMTRGNPAIEYMLNEGLRYTSGPQWLAENLLRDRWVVAVAGTHGKTTTSAMIAWILEYAGRNPGFLIGGVPADFEISARLGQKPFFVVEADEYDTAFFDKRSKFIHYGPKTLVLNNLEMDHADIFDNLAQIQRQFHHLIRTVPGCGLIIYSSEDDALNQVLQMGCWTPLQPVAIRSKSFYEDVGDTSTPPVFYLMNYNTDGSTFTVAEGPNAVGQVRWNLSGRHNMSNALAAIAAAKHVGISPTEAIAALNCFKGVKRRMELRGSVAGVDIYDDFAHHPTAIRTTLEGLRAKFTTANIIAVLEPRSNTMRLGIHADQLADALKQANLVYVYAPPTLEWDVATTMQDLGNRLQVHSQVQTIVEDITAKTKPGAGELKCLPPHTNSKCGEHPHAPICRCGGGHPHAPICRCGGHPHAPRTCVVVMSNGGFADIHQRLLDAIAAVAASS